MTRVALIRNGNWRSVLIYTCTAAAAIAIIIRPIQSNSRQSLPGSALESSGGFEANDGPQLPYIGLQRYSETLALKTLPFKSTGTESVGQTYRSNPPAWSISAPERPVFL